MNNNKSVQKVVRKKYSSQFKEVPWGVTEQHPLKKKCH
jgi:hypothetical protein